MLAPSRNPCGKLYGDDEDIVDSCLAARFVAQGESMEPGAVAEQHTFEYPDRDDGTERLVVLAFLEPSEIAGGPVVEHAARESLECLHLDFDLELPFLLVYGPDIEDDVLVLPEET